MFHAVRGLSQTTAAERERALQRLLSETRARRSEFARQRRLSGDIVTLMREAGVFRALVARRFGGDEQRPSDFYRMIERISSADGSAGWVASFGHAALYLAALPVGTLEAIYADGPDVIFAGGLFPSRPTRRVADGILVNGRWSWASGCTAANYLGVGITIDDGSPQSGLPRMAVFASERATIIDNWQVNGLAGTGSHDIEVNNIVVPDDWTFIRGGRASLDAPLFRYPAMAIASQVLAVVGLGTARSALDEAIAMAGERASITGGPRMAERAHVQIELAKAEAQLRSARAFLYETTDQAYDRLVAGDELGPEMRTLLRLGATNAARTGADVARAAYTMCGTVGIFTDHPLAQSLQDALAVPTHAMIAEVTWQAAGRMLLGLEAAPGFP
jgi:alkylation response protein AidB-like acyl-CoA dehydrogenase